MTDKQKAKTFLLKNKFLIINSVLLLAWSFFQYTLLNRFYAVFITVFFFGQLILRKRYFVLLAVSVLSVVLFKTPVLDTIQTLKENNVYFIWNPREPITNIFTARAGENVLPNNVQKILSLLRYYEIPSYALSDELAHDSLIFQRTIEASWPKKYDPASAYIFKLHEETELYTDCTLIEQVEEIDLVYCD